MYMSDPEKRALFEEMLNTLKVDSNMEDLKHLTREEVIESVERIELSKFDIQQQMYEAIKQKRLPPKLIN